MAYRVCPEEYKNPAWVYEDEPPVVCFYKVVTPRTSVVTGKQINLKHFESGCFEQCREYAANLAKTYTGIIDTVAVFTNGHNQVCGEYEAYEGEFIIHAEDEEPEYDGE